MIRLDIEKTISLELRTNCHVPLGGSTYIELPETLKRKSVLNVITLKRTNVFYGLSLQYSTLLLFIQIKLTIILSMNTNLMML